MSVLAIIPARGGSKGVPLKNIKELGGKPLVAHTIDQAKKSKFIDRILVNSENEKIRNISKEFGAEIMDRIEEFYHDNSVQEVDRLLYWIVEQLELKGENIDTIILLYPTAPLRDVESIDKAIDMVLNKGYDSVLSLYEDSTYLWKVSSNTAVPTNYDPKTRGPRQKEEWNQWAENKAIYVMTRDLLMNTKCRLGGKIGYVEMSKLRSIDIDKPEDFVLCEKLIDIIN